MSDFFEIDTAILNRNISSLRDELEILQNEFRLMLEGITELDGVWEGPAKKAFSVQFQGDYSIFTDYCKDISKLIDSLEYASKEYDNCEGKVKAAIEAIRI